ncbi:class I SAM-dependent methyltransferase [Salinisphaera orenii]|uniref:class I SAM-dependent methyltransferase n=1 Tax=Salinisphaera orenii TaxID=856731 RepID=UPI001610CBBD|nr:class I SAM-dependent methyltransferase [Salinisphaera orenii]
MSDAIVPDARFAADWLALREPADHAARSSGLSEAAAARLAAAPDDTLRIVDLGCGSGSNLRHLAPRLPGPQHWHLVDHDADLLARAARECADQRDRSGRPVTITTIAADLDHDPGALIAEAHLVTAAALLDLVDADWLDRLATACAAHVVPALIALSVDGDLAFETDGAPEDDEDDAFVFARLAEHQRRDKGFGAALGTQAPAAFERAFQRHGWHVAPAATPWRLGRDDARLAAALIDGWREAATAQAPARAARIAGWARRRAADVAAGRACCRVGHRDLLATPPRAEP